MDYLYHFQRPLSSSYQSSFDSWEVKEVYWGQIVVVRWSSQTFVWQKRFRKGRESVNNDEYSGTHQCHKRDGAKSTSCFGKGTKFMCLNDCREV
ncbi:hypothetical protein TNCV_3292221 [Trichonephila clavipes]|nr:hypothetical protein TNCV_3292221 [Trichonephila clavipes]